MNACPVGALACLALLCGCPSPSASAPAPDAAAAASPAPADAAAPTHEWKLLEKLDAKIEVPAGASLDDTSSEGRPPSYSLYDSTGFFSATLRESPPGEGAGLEAAREARSGAKLTREEQSADGWLLQWEMQRPGDPTRVDFGVDSLRKVSGRSVRCFRVLSSAPAAAAAARACLSLAPR